MFIPIPIPSCDTEKKPDHVGEGLLQGINKLGDRTWAGMSSLWNKPQEGAREEGALGFVKGVGQGTLDLAGGVAGGTIDLVSKSLEGVRHTPDAIADAVQGSEREHKKHGVDDEKGGMLDTHIESEQEKHPEHVGEGLLYGGKALMTGVWDGVCDLGKKPMDGAKEEGAVGFVKGVGSGVGGFLAKTVSGAIDMTQSVGEGLQQTPAAVERAWKGEQTPNAAQGASSSSGAKSTNETPLFTGTGHKLGDS